MLKPVNFLFISWMMTSLCMSQTIPTSEPVSALWSVSSAGDNGSDHHCLLLSANLSIILVHPGEDVRNMTEDVRRLHWKMEVPQYADARGVCGDTESQISLHWEDREEEENVVNMVVTRNGRLAELTGVFARFFLHSSWHEVTSTMQKLELNSLSWPHRYCLSCMKTLYYPLYKVSEVQRNHNLRKDDDVPPAAFLVVDNLMFEVFRKQEASVTKKLDIKTTLKMHSKRNWECEFHVIYDWAPFVLGGVLIFIVVLSLLVFIFKSCLGCSDHPRRDNYQKL